MWICMFALVCGVLFALVCGVLFALVCGVMSFRVAAARF